MLHLLSTQSGAVPLAGPTAALLERALLADGCDARCQLLVIALESDPHFATWAQATSGPPCVAHEELAAKLCNSLASKLQDSLLSNGTSSNLAPESLAGLSAAELAIEQRLPAVIAKLTKYEKLRATFEASVEREKLESLKELAYGAGHEINNPLANIAARAQTLLADEAQPERRRKLIAIHRQAMRAHEMIADLMLFARPPKIVYQEIVLNPLLKQVIDEFAELAAEKSVQLTCVGDEPPVIIQGDDTQLRVAVAALIKNAIEACAANGRVDAVARQTVIEGRRCAEIVVRDDGPGISPEIRRQLFDPFYSGREAGRGLGFGLSKCWRIVTDHGGHVIVSSAPGQGAEFRISLPVE